MARDLLAPVYGWFTEGFDTLDLKEAKACSMSCTPDHRFRNPRLAIYVSTRPDLPPLKLSEFVAVHVSSCPPRHLMRRSNMSGIGGQADVRSAR